ncbi:DUF1214 domain-containing protein [Mesorhizobium zhangyense]|uniref:DUF1214 domain-containing protein n=1 Tax=Mesorhizobium zhangyense TaxID=1776730 RepID=UPI0028A8B77E|nr:DUF1214 domain-containing protein [Mesorhizobium zhangyense]
MPEQVATWALRGTGDDTETRAFFDNTPDGVVDRSSRADIMKNGDGSVDLYTGPTSPTGQEKNWSPTISGKAWSALFRFYRPTEPYFDRSWSGRTSLPASKGRAGPYSMSGTSPSPWLADARRFATSISIW